MQAYHAQFEENVKRRLVLRSESHHHAHGDYAVHPPEPAIRHFETIVAPNMDTAQDIADGIAHLRNWKVIDVIIIVEWTHGS